MKKTMFGIILGLLIGFITFGTLSLYESKYDTRILSEDGGYLSTLRFHFNEAHTGTWTSYGDLGAGVANWAAASSDSLLMYDADGAATSKIYEFALDDLLTDLRNNIAADEAYAAGWNADVGPPQKDDVYDYLVNFDADADGSYTDETWYDAIAKVAGDAYTGNHDFGGADLEIPQAAPGVPDADGEIEMDFTDGSLVIQHGSAHAELAAATDVVIAKLINSFAATLANPDTLQSEIDQWMLKSIRASEFPHGIVVTEVYLATSASSSLAVNVENWDDPVTINGSNPTIDAIATSTSTETTEDTITYSTIAAGQLIMLDLDTTDVSWAHVEVQYYEPAA
jgi:hypothetical protein